MITIKDIVELAKAGYKVNEVKELIELSKTEETNNLTDTNSDLSFPHEAAADSSSDPSPAAAEGEKETEDIDYKALYEQAKKDLSIAQKENIKSDISSAEDNKTDEDIIKDLIKDFM